MKKCIKNFVTMFLVFAMVIAMAAPGEASAATKINKKLTMYVGEAFQGYLYGSTVKSVKSSNSKVVKAGKSSEYKYAYTMTAKKKGTATVTVTYKYGSKTKTYRLKITVKKIDITITPERLEGGNVMFKIKNNTAQCFNSITFSYKLKDSNGDVVVADSDSCSYVTAKSTSYDTVYVSSSLDIDDSLSSAKVTSVSRDPDYTYKNITSKQLVVKKKDGEKTENYINFKLTYTNKLNYYVMGYTYIFLYDENNNIIGLDKNSIYLSKKKTDTKSISRYISPYSYPSYDHYKIVTRAYYYYK